MTVAVRVNDYKRKETQFKFENYNFKAHIYLQGKNI